MPNASRFQTSRRHSRHILGLCTALTLAGLVTPSIARDTIPTQEVRVDVEVLASGLDHPWGVEVLPDGALIVTERSGALRLVRDGSVSRPVDGLPRIAARGQGGLLDVALARDFASSRTLYISYSTDGPNGLGTAIARARLSEDGSALSDVEEIFSMNRFTRVGRHFGSRIAVAEDGTLYFSIGDRGDADRAQDLGDHAGSVLRINPDGSAPEDNPFVDGGGAPEIWSAGHRNPQGMDFDPDTGVLYAVEHGARGGDEVNRPQPGLNYGWPVISYGRHYSGGEIGIGTAAEGYEQPIHYWDPSIAPGGMAVYRGEMFPEWDGDLLVAALKYQLLVRLDLDAETREVIGEERMLKGDYGRIRDVIVAPDGAVLMLTDADNGMVLRMSRTPDAID
ncbi:MAG: PQQ-dependent sugar dehydrogenase [Hoeflea sp.]|uniref:PQQ-dependent sugar dehydrogenase n=1 Tax=Hoeflea sp. TaxID=1940281 RepID=UPI0032EC487A